MGIIKPEINSKQRFIEYEDLTMIPFRDSDEEKPIGLIDYHIKTINEIEAKSTYISHLNYSELLELRKRIDAIEDNEIAIEIIGELNEYIREMNKLQDAYDNNRLQAFLLDPPTILYLYSKYFNDQYGVLTETGIEVAKAINEAISPYDNYTPRINIPENRKGAK